MQNAVDMFYDYEEVIIDEEETFDGIHIIIEGLVKVGQQLAFVIEVPNNY